MKVIFPLFSKSAAGTIADVLTFSKRKSGQQCRYQKRQKDVITAPRSSIRADYQKAVAAWGALSEVQQEVYVERAANLHYTGYNLFIKEYLDGLPAYYGLGVFGVGEY